MGQSAERLCSARVGVRVCLSMHAHARERKRTERKKEKKKKSEVQRCYRMCLYFTL